MKKRYNGKSKWIPLFLCVCLFISLLVPFIPGVLAEEEETIQAVADREMVYPLACFTTQTSSQPPLVQNDTGISPFFWAVVSPSVSDPMEGYAYRFPNGDDYENFFYCRGDWYYLGSGTQQTFYGISIDPLGTPAADSFTYNEAIIIDPSKAIAVEDLDTLAPKTVKITWENRVDDSLTIEYAEKQTLSAHPDGFLLPSYQWQILLNAEADIWVNIADKTEADCEVSYALVKNMLDAANSAYLRCAVREGAETAYSTPISVTVLPEPVFEDVLTEPVAPLYLPQEVAMEPDTEAGLLQSVFTRFSQMNKLGDSLVPASENPPQGVGSDEEYVTITINYLDYSKYHKEGERHVVRSPYVATIEANSTFSQESVKSPTVVGYAPYYDADTTDEDDEPNAPADSIPFSTTTPITADLTIDVFYKAIRVPFAVKFFFQNVDNDLYTENTSLYTTDYAETGSKIKNDYLERITSESATPDALMGFTNLYHLPEEVAADGSTIFEVYYDRNYYLVQFDLDGGYGVDPVYARYESAFAISDPVRPGYVFDHWELIYIDENDNGVWDTTEAKSGINGLVSTIPVHNYYYRAVWGTVNTHYTTVYWIEHKDGSKEYLDHKTTTSVLSGSKVSGTNDYASLSTCSLETCAYGECPYRDVEHNTHTLSCYTTYNLAQVTSLPTFKGSYTITEGNVYRYRKDRNNYYNYFYLGGIWYDLGMSAVADIYSNYGIIVTGLSNPSNIGYVNSRPASLLSTCPATHGHDSSCAGLKYYKFDRADTGVTVMGDGSTVVNVYYKPREYTLRFYYAATTGGTDTDSDGVPDTGYTSYQIIGGSTYYFGKSGYYNTDDDILLLDDEFSRNDDKTKKTITGNVTALPQIKEGLEDRYEFGRIKGSGERTYHYIQFTAEYKQDISDRWPCAVFESATRTGSTNGKLSGQSNGWEGDQAYVSAWNGEHHVKYTQDNGNQTIKGKYQVLDENLLFDSQFEDALTVSYLCFWENGSSNIKWNYPNLFVYNIWVPVLSGESTDSLTTKTFGEPSTLYKQIDSYPTCDDNTTNYAVQTQPSLVGFQKLTYEGRPIPDETKEEYGNYKKGYEVDFYYTRISYDFTMMNLGDTVVDTTSVPYQTSLSSLSQLSVLGANYEPPYPSTLEAGAYTFDGWYTTAQGLEGTKVNLATYTMPVGGLVLYAHWVKVEHQVNFFQTRADLTAYQESSDSGLLYSSKTVPHGEVYGEVTTPDIPDMRFGGWFYIDKGEKKAFAPMNMPVNQDLDVFAEWSDNSPQPFRISYVLQGTTTKIADDTVGRAYSGTTRTFKAAVGAPYNQLYSDLDGVNYNNGYFPTISSHSITVQREDDPDNLQYNTFSFEYVHADHIKYTVQYLDRETKQPLLDEYIDYTDKAIVTKRFAFVDGYIPDAFSKRLILEVEYDQESGKYVGTDNNVITFYYTRDDSDAFYTVHYMLEKLGDHDPTAYDVDGTGGYEESGFGVEGIAEVTNTSANPPVPPLYITPQTIAGFVYEPLASQAKIHQGGAPAGTAAYDASTGRFTLPIAKSGSELYIFYQRLSYPYRVHYYAYNTGSESTDPTQLHNDTTGTGIYGATVSVDFIPISGYTCVNSDTKNITIHDGENANTINFYYRPNEYIVEYVAVTSDDGLLSVSRETVSGSETFVGSTPTAKSNCVFEGWYKDAACTVQVTEADGTVDTETNKFTPNVSKENLSATETNYFYAKFTKQAGNLTIQRTGAAEDQVFVYELRSVENPAYVIYVTVTGNSSVTIHDLPLGDYTVTQQNGWSWRYTDASQPVAHNTDGTTVTFGQSEQTNQWLNGNSTIVPNQRGS